MSQVLPIDRIQAMIRVKIGSIALHSEATQRKGALVHGSGHPALQRESRRPSCWPYATFRFELRRHAPARWSHSWITPAHGTRHTARPCALDDNACQHAAALRGQPMACSSTVSMNMQTAIREVRAALCGRSSPRFTHVFERKPMPFVGMPLSMRASSTCYWP